MRGALLVAGTSSGVGKSALAVLLKPGAGGRTQIVLLGHPVAEVSPAGYRPRRGNFCGPRWTAWPGCPPGSTS